MKTKRNNKELKFPTYDVIKKLEFLRNQSASKNDVVQANRYWRLLESFKLYDIYYNFFISIKNHDYRKAWCQLEECELKCDNIIENSSTEFLLKSKVITIQKIVEQWQALYPYTLFVSPEYKIKRYSCSICGCNIKPRNRCSHKKGILYNGEICFHIIDDFEILSFSIVTNPVQKYSVIHNDDTLNFTHLDFLIDKLEYPLEEWSFKKNTIKHSIDKFHSIEKDSLCPCNSKAVFKDCCINKKEILLPNFDFIFNKNLSPSEEVYYSNEKL